MSGRVAWGEVVRHIAGLRYQAAAQAVRWLGTTLELDEDRQRFIAELKR